MRRRARTDNNQTEIVAVLRNAGASVQSLATVGGGCPDLLVGYRGVNYLLEVKRGGGKLTPDQEEWFLAWDGLAEVVRTPEDALAAIGGWSLASPAGDSVE